MAGESVPQHMRREARRCDTAGRPQRLEVAGKMLAAEVAGLSKGGEQPFR